MPHALQTVQLSSVSELVSVVLTKITGCENNITVGLLYGKHVFGACNSTENKGQLQLLELA